MDQAVGFGKTHANVYTEPTSDHPIDLTRYQVANRYMGRAPLINSGGAGLIMGRKAFQRSMKEGVELLHAVQDVYLDAEITVA